MGKNPIAEARKKGKESTAGMVPSDSLKQLSSLIDRRYDLKKSLSDANAVVKRLENERSELKRQIIKLMLEFNLETAGGVECTVSVGKKVRWQIDDRQQFIENALDTNNLQWLVVSVNASKVKSTIENLGYQPEGLTPFEYDTIVSERKR